MNTEIGASKTFCWFEDTGGRGLYVAALEEYHLANKVRSWTTAGGGWIIFIAGGNQTARRQSRCDALSTQVPKVKRTGSVEDHQGRRVFES